MLYSKTWIIWVNSFPFKQSSYWISPHTQKKINTNVAYDAMLVAGRERCDYFERCCLQCNFTALSFCGKQVHIYMLSRISSNIHDHPRIDSTASQKHTLTCIKDAVFAILPGVIPMLQPALLRHLDLFIIKFSLRQSPASKLPSSSKWCLAAGS